VQLQTLIVETMLQLVNINVKLEVSFLCFNVCVDVNSRVDSASPPDSSQSNELPPSRGASGAFSASGHSAALLHGLSALRARGQLLDVELAVNQERFGVHRAVLAACSDYFRSVWGPLGALREALRVTPSTALSEGLEGGTETPLHRVPVMPEIL